MRHILMEYLLNCLVLYPRIVGILKSTFVFDLHVSVGL